MSDKPATYTMDLETTLFGYIVGVNCYKDKLTAKLETSGHGMIRCYMYLNDNKLFNKFIKYLKGRDEVSVKGVEKREFPTLRVISLVAKEIIPFPKDHGSPEKLKAFQEYAAPFWKGVDVTEFMRGLRED